MKTVTKASLDLLVKLARDAGNWSGTPMLDITKEERGNLTQLKQEKLLTTFKDEGIEWVNFNLAVGESVEVTDGSRDFRLIGQPMTVECIMTNQVSLAPTSTVLTSEYEALKALAQAAFGHLQLTWGGVHPASDNLQEKIDALRATGFRF